MPNNESTSVAPITLTAEQIISLVGHGVTQEQLDSARRELGEKMDAQDARFDIKFDKLAEKMDAQDAKFDIKFDKLDAKIDAVNKELSTKIDIKFDRLDDKIDKKFNLILGFLLTSVAGIVALGFWLGQNVIK